MVGNNLTRYLLDRGYDVRGIDDLSGCYIDNIDKRLIVSKRFHVFDLNSPETDKLIAEYRPDVVFHLAAYAALGVSPFVRKFNYTSNILASVNVINACVNHGVRKLIYTSSMDVYGKQKPPFREDYIPQPIDPYGIAKYAVEMDIVEAYNRFGLEYAIIRPHNIIGVYQNVWDKYRNVVGIWIRQVINGEPITIFGDGATERAFSDIKYYMAPMEGMITGYKYGVFNMGSDRVYSLNEVSEVVLEVAKEHGYDGTVTHLPGRRDVESAYCTHDKAKVLLGLRDETNLKGVISEMFKWVLTQPRREVRTIPYEINKGVYEYWR